MRPSRTADAATRASVEAALDAAFETVLPGRLRQGVDCWLYPEADEERRPGDGPRLYESMSRGELL